MLAPAWIVSAAAAARFHTRRFLKNPPCGSRATPGLGGAPPIRAAGMTPISAQPAGSASSSGWTLCRNWCAFRWDVLQNRASKLRSNSTGRQGVTIGSTCHTASNGSKLSSQGFSASEPAWRRGSRRSRVRPSCRASRPRRISPRAGTAGISNPPGPRAAPASPTGRCRAR